MFIIWKKISKAYLRYQGRTSPGRDYPQSAYKHFFFLKDRALLDISNIYIRGIIVKIKYNNPQRAIEALSMLAILISSFIATAIYAFSLPGLLG